MTTPAPDAPIVVTKLGPGTLRVGSTEVGADLSCHTSATEFGTDTSQDDPIPVLCGRKIAAAAEFSATIGGTVLLDLSDPASIFYYSHAHKGEQVPVHFIPNTDVGLDITGTITMTPLGIAGDVQANTEAEFEWSFVEFPEIAPPGGAAAVSTPVGEVAPLVDENAA